MKKKTRKIITLTFAILLIVLVQVIGVTYAKYIASENATGQAEIAQWAFQIKKDGETTKNIDLGSTVDSNTLVDGKIAPGTSGQFVITLDATGSEVNTTYSLKFTNEKNKPKNLYFTYQGEKFKSLGEIGEIVGTIRYNDVVRTHGIPISWVWSYETGTSTTDIATNDKIDTENANSITEYTFDAVVTATQSK